MDVIEIDGGNRLNGTIDISGAKNSALPIICASILLDTPVVLKNIPILNDIKTMLKLLGHLGAKYELDEDKHTLYIDSTDITSFDAPYDLVKKMRASIFAMGPLLGKYHYTKASLPGGCAIGVRPIDLHIKAFEQLGAHTKLQLGYIEIKAKKLKGSTIYFDMKTVGGTENAIMAAVLADGITIIENAAQEPEIVDLARFLKSAGAQIDGAGTEKITIEGVSSLKLDEYTIISDRIEAGTFLIAAAVTKGDVTLKNIEPALIDSTVSKLREIGSVITVGDSGIRCKGASVIKPTNIKTAPHPGFPTDMQAQFTAALSLARGVSTVKESIFENRFMHVAELKRMGANIRIVENVAVINGVKTLFGAPVMATDLRASAALIIAGLVAKGKTTIQRVYHLDRGYERIELKLRSLGAKIERLKGGGV